MQKKKGGTCVRGILLFKKKKRIFRHICLCYGVIINSISVERAAKKVDVT